jgi:hypothetical protein
MVDKDRAAEEFVLIRSYAASTLLDCATQRTSAPKSLDSLGTVET